MDKLAFMTGYLSGLDNATDVIVQNQLEKQSAVVPEQHLYGYAPEAMEHYEYVRRKNALKKKLLAKLIGASVGAGTGAAVGGKYGGKWGAILGALSGILPGASVGHGLGESGIVGSTADDRPLADIVRELKVRQNGPGTSYEEDYMKPLQRSRIV